MPSLTMEARVRRVLSRSLRPAQAAARRGMLRAADSLVMLRPAQPDAKRVLIVRLDNIGDFVVWLHAAEAIVAHFRSQGMHVTLLGSAAWASFAAKLALFDEVIALDQQAFKNNFRYRRGLMTTLRRDGYGMVLQPTLSRYQEMGDAAVRITGAMERIGVALPSASAGTRRRAADRKLYTTLLPAPADSMSEMRANAFVVRALTGKAYQPKLADLRPAVDMDCLGELASVLPTSPYVVLFPGASAPGRQWPVERFAALAQLCREQSDAAVLLCGGPGDRALAEAAARAAGEGVISVAGKTNLQQLTTIIAGAQMLVSNETSAIHIAAAVGVPSVCIVGGGHYGRFVPYDEAMQDHRPLPIVATHKMECFGCNWTCRFHPAKGKPMPCIEEISLESVWNVAAPLLKVDQLQKQEVATCV